MSHTFCMLWIDMTMLVSIAELVQREDRDGRVLAKTSTYWNRAISLPQEILLGMPQFLTSWICRWVTTLTTLPVLLVVRLVGSLH